jgi:hypothetical protein
MILILLIFIHEKIKFDFITELPSILIFFLINIDVFIGLNYFYCNIYLILKLSGIYYFYLMRLMIIYKINDNSRILFYYFYIKYY